jgi:hypothetical protein
MVGARQPGRTHRKAEPLSEYINPLPKVDAVTASAVVGVRTNIDGSKALLLRVTFEDEREEEHTLIPIASLPVT